MTPKNLDILALRSFVLIADGLSFSQVGDVLGRSQSAISLQLQRLERELGTPLLRRRPRPNAGRQALLTAAGGRLLPLARGLIGVNDVALSTMGHGTPCTISFGVTHELAHFMLARVLPQFLRVCPKVEITLAIDTTAKLIAAIAQRDLDVAIALKHADVHNRGLVAEAPMIWLGSGDFALDAQASLPLGVCYRLCPFRSAAIDALDRTRRFHVAAVSSSFAGLSGPLRAGMCVTVRTSFALQSDLADLGERIGLPTLPPVQFASYVSGAKQVAAVVCLIACCRHALSRRDPADVPGPCDLPEDWAPRAVAGAEPCPASGC